MYNPISIAPLSEAQITKALKGLPVRVSAGNKHDIELSKEQLKKFSKAQKLGKAMNITLDPFQIQNHMRLIGSGSGGFGMVFALGRINSNGGGVLGAGVLGFAVRLALACSIAR